MSLDKEKDLDMDRNKTHLPEEDRGFLNFLYDIVFDAVI